jgi:hypothetical protein
MCDAGFGRDNRIGFDYASVTIDPNDGSRPRIDAVARIFKRFPFVHLQIDAHCGNAAPIGIAPQFSRLRATVVRQSIDRAILGLLPIYDDDHHHHYDIDRDRLDVLGHGYDGSRVSSCGWGRTVAAAAARSEHPLLFVETARDGKGWVDIFFRIPTCDDGDEFLELPSRPDYYNGVSRLDVEREGNEEAQDFVGNFHVHEEAYR